MARPKPSDPLQSVTVKFPERLVTAVDQRAERDGVTRSDVVREAAEKYTARDHA